LSDRCRSSRALVSSPRLLATQNFNQAIRITDRGYIIVHGEIVAVPVRSSNFEGNDIVRRLYLGEVA
jgi:branched-chain amino acid transport system ATP-binding protein